MYWIKASVAWLLLFTFVSCGTDSEKEQMLQGTWTAVEILRGGEQVSPDGVQFIFSEDQYTYKAPGYQEEGTFWVEGKKLYTEGEAVMKKSVEMETLTKDSLVLRMNDKGIAMRMALIRH